MTPLPRGLGRASSACLAAALVGVTALPAQNPAPGEEAIRLSPFTVSESRDTGYTANTSISGTRINVPLRDLPVTLQVVTEDFIRDLGVFDTQSALRYSNVVVSGDTGATIRGFNILWSQRNGFRRYDYGDAVNIDRVEVIKGPTSVLYGVSRAGGITNNITKRPVFGRQAFEVRQVLGEDDFYRTELDANVGQLGGNFAFRFLGSYTSAGSPLSNVDSRITFWNPVVSWMPSPRTLVTLEGEFLNRDRVPAPGRYFNRGQLPNGVPWGWLDEVVPGIDINRRYVDNSEFQRNRANTIFLTVDQQLADGLDLRFGAYWIDRADTEVSTSRRGFRANTLGSLRDRNGNLVLDAAGRAIPALSRHWASDSSKNDWQSYQLDLTWRFETGPVQHRLLAGGYWSEDLNRRLLYEDRNYTPPASGLPPTSFGGRAVAGVDRGNLLAPNVRWTPLQPLGNAYDDLSINNPLWAPANFTVPWLDYLDEIRNSALYLTHNAKLFDDRLDTLLGLRLDYSEKTRRDQKGWVGFENAWEDDYLSPQAGAIFKITPEVSVYAMYSESFDPQNGASNSFGEQFDPLIGVNFEVGTKFDLLAGRLSGTVSLFQVTEENRIVNDPTRPNAGGTLGDSVAAGELESTGVDASVFLNLTPEWSTVLNAAYVDRSLARGNPGQNPLPVEDARGAGFNWSVWSNYEWREGALTGLSIGGGVVYEDEWYGTNVPVAGDIYFGDYYTVDARVGYEFTWQGYRISTALNLLNVLDNEKQGRGDWVSPREIRLTAGVRF